MFAGEEGQRVTDLTMGIDIGTTSVKGVVADGDGTVVARVRVPHALHITAPDRMEHDAVSERTGVLVDRFLSWPSARPPMITRGAGAMRKRSHRPVLSLY